MDPSKQKQKEIAAKKAKRGDLGLGMSNKSQFDAWIIGDKYKCEKILGQGSYGQVAQAI